MIWYLFPGSTSFGFLNGATVSSRGNTSGLLPDTTSYDYDSPITEYGSYSAKYNSIKEVIVAHNKVQTKPVSPPVVTSPTAYPSVKPSGQFLLSYLIEGMKEKISSTDVLPMEKLNINKNSGQSYGYTVYRKTQLTISANAVLKIAGYVQDTVLVLLNGKLISPTPKTQKDLAGFGFWKLHDSTLTLSRVAVHNVTLDLVVENFGRNARGSLYFKGLSDPVYINDQKLTNWQIVPFEFKKTWTNALSGWRTVASRTEPALYKFSLTVANPEDTFVDMSKWTKGIVIVNGFVLGRHFFTGPQQTLYLPAPFLKKGVNDIIVFEHYSAPESLDFSKVPIFETRS